MELIKWRLELNGDFDQTFLSYIVEPLLTVKLVARKRRLYKYACRQSFGNIAGSYLEIYFIVLKISKLNF